MPSVSGLAPSAPSMSSFCGYDRASKYDRIAKYDFPSGYEYHLPEVPSLPFAEQPDPQPGSQQARTTAMLRDGDPDQMSRFTMNPPAQETSLKQRSCHHPNRTKAGSNAIRASFDARTAATSSTSRRRMLPRAWNKRSDFLHSCSQELPRHHSHDLALAMHGLRRDRVWIQESW